MAHTHTVKLFNRYGEEIGKLRQSWHYLPAIIRIEETVYQRYGRLGDYRYVEEGFLEVTEQNAEVIWKG